MTDAPRIRLEDLRRFASALGTAAGVAPARASELAAHLLWFDAAGLGRFGIETLPVWLERIEQGEIDPSAEGKVASETIGTAVLEGGGGLPPLVLARAGELAVEKARDAGVGLVRVTQLGATGPAAGVAAEMAIGPVAALILGPGPSWALALPAGGGLPAVFDSALATGSEPTPLAAIGPLALALVPEGGWLVSAIELKAIERPTAFHERVLALASDLEETPGRLVPGPWQRRRQSARERGVSVTAACWVRFQEWAGRLGVPLPPPASSPPSPDPPTAGAS